MKIAVNVGKAPEEKTSKNGRTYWSFRAADNHKNGNEERTLWFWVSYFGEDEALVSTLQSGDRVEVDGILEARPYERRDGTMDPGLSIACFELKKLPKKDAKEGAAPEKASAEKAPAEKAPAASNAPKGAGSAPPERLPSDDFDDDIPF